MIQRQVLVFQKVQKTMEVPQGQFMSRVLDVTVVLQFQVPTGQTAQKTVEAECFHPMQQRLHLRWQLRFTASPHRTSTAVSSVFWLSSLGFQLWCEYSLHQQTFQPDGIGVDREVTPVLAETIDAQTGVESAILSYTLCLSGFYRDGVG